MFNPAILPTVGGPQTVAGEMAMGDVVELQKALTAGYGSDVSQLSGAGALRIQSLEKTMLSTIQENKHFALFNELQKTNATATVDEWTEQSAVGGFLGGSTNSETGNIAVSQGTYNRRVGLVKYLMTQRQVSFVASLQNSIVEAEAVEQQNGALQLLTDAEYLCFEGDSNVVTQEFDGIYAQIKANNTDHILDAAGQSLASISLVDQAASLIAGYGNFGTPTHLFMSQLNQSDFNTNLDPAFRVALTGSAQEIMLGAPVKGISTSWGDIKTVPDVFIRDGNQQQPFEVAFSYLANINSAFQPASITASAGAGGADSQWATQHAGTYYYAVTGINANGQTVSVFSSQITVAAGQQVTLTISKSSGGTETGYVIYRSRRGGTNSPTDMRQMVRIAAAGASTGTVSATTTYVDKNADIPGTTKSYMLNMLPTAQAITWRQFLPMTKFALYPTQSAVIPWAQMLFGYLRIGKSKHHVVIKNILPSGATWLPF